MDKEQTIKAMKKVIVQILKIRKKKLVISVICRNQPICRSNNGI